MKLTQAQSKLLQEVSKEGGMRVSETYPPAKKLVVIGLCEFKRGKYGSMSITITDAGRKALEDRE